MDTSNGHVCTWNLEELKRMDYPQDDWWRCETCGTQLKAATVLEAIRKELVVSRRAVRPV